MFIPSYVSTFVEMCITVCQQMYLIFHLNVKYATKRKEMEQNNLNIKFKNKLHGRKEETLLIDQTSIQQFQRRQRLE